VNYYVALEIVDATMETTNFSYQGY